MGRRSRRGGAAGLHRSDTVVGVAAQTVAALERGPARADGRNRLCGVRGAPGRPTPWLSGGSGGELAGRCRCSGACSRAKERSLAGHSPPERRREGVRGQVAKGWRDAAGNGPGRVLAGRKRGPANPADAGAGRAPVGRWRRYRVCSRRNAWALSDPLPAAAVMVRRARAVLASAAVRAPRMGTWWSRNSVTAL